MRCCAKEVTTPFCPICGAKIVECDDVGYGILMRINRTIRSGQTYIDGLGAHLEMRPDNERIKRRIRLARKTSEKHMQEQKWVAKHLGIQAERIGL